MLREASKEDMFDRMTTVYERSRVTQNDEPRVGDRMKVVLEEARLYYKYAYIPFWPPKALLAKIVRKLLLPILMPQVVFNEAVRDVLLDLLSQLRQSEKRQAAHEVEMRSLLQEMDFKLQALSPELNPNESRAPRRASGLSSVNYDAHASTLADRGVSPAAIDTESIRVSAIGRAH